MLFSRLLSLNFNPQNAHHNCTRQPFDFFIFFSAKIRLDIFLCHLSAYQMINMGNLIFSEK